VYAKFIWKEKVNGGLNDGRNEKRIQYFTTLVEEFFW
jgi:hypothetical protein